MRYLSIDMLRTAAIIMMVIVHFVENLSAGYAAANADAPVDLFRRWWLPTGLAAPLFTLLAGVSYAIWVDLQERRGLSDDVIARRTVRRGLFLFGLGLAFNLFVWLPEDIFNWDILTLIGSALLLLEAVRRMPESVAALLCGLIFLVAPVLRVAADYASYWTNFYFDYDFTLSDVLLGYLVVGYFPVFPWLLMPTVGFLVGRRLFVSTADGGPGPRTVFVGCTLGLLAIVCGAGLMALSRGGVLPPRLDPGSWTMFPPTMAYLLGNVGIGMVALTLLHAVIDKGPAAVTARLRSLCGTISRHSLSIYLLHHVVHVWPLWVYGLASVGEPTAFWQTALPAGTAVLLAVLFLAGCYPLFAWIERRGLPTAESAMRWLCD
jgi:uncharacterized membrane protein